MFFLLEKTITSPSRRDRDRGHLVLPSVAGVSSTAARLVALGLTVALCVALSGCASSGRRDQRPRMPDEDVLRQEASATHSPEPLFQLSLLYLHQNRPDDAVSALLQSLQRDPLYVPSLTLLARTLHQSGRVFEALDYFSRKPVEAWPEPVQIKIALLQAAAGNTSEARDILQSKRQGAWAEEAHASLAYLDLLDEETMMARKRLEDLIDQNIDSPEVLNSLAVARLRAGDLEGSVEILQRLTSTHRDFVPARLNLALLLQHWLFDESGAERSQAHLDTLVEPLLSEAVLRQLVVPAPVENAAPPVPPLPPEERP